MQSPGSMGVDGRFMRIVLVDVTVTVAAAASLLAVSRSVPLAGVPRVGWEIIPLLVAVQLVMLAASGLYGRRCRQDRKAVAWAGVLAWPMLALGDAMVLGWLGRLPVVPAHLVGLIAGCVALAAALSRGAAPPASVRGVRADGARSLSLSGRDRRSGIGLRVETQATGRWAEDNPRVIRGPDGSGVRREPLAFEDARRRRIDLDLLPADWLSGAAVAREGRATRVLRRGFDLLGGMALIVLTLPVLLLTAVAVRLDSRGPVLYRQERVGQDGRVFTLFKFRSMTVDAEAGGPCWATPGDPRVTRVGRFIRLTRIDELPQVFNVLRGEMALIGPRPERPAFVEQLAAVIPHYWSRSAIRPGITGWAQVNYPYGASVEDARHKLAYDLYYLYRRNLRMDLSIVAATIRIVISGEGAR
jgi:lipopolysaccharide/colanic/teichoic acid biosynthesis glycosyltransferase